jgi:hypothetical protein
VKDAEAVYHSKKSIKVKLVSVANMPKDYSRKNIEKLKIYLSQNGDKTTNIKSDSQADKGHSAKPRPN